MKVLIRRIAILFIFLDNMFLPIDIGVDFRVNYLFMAVFILGYFALVQKVNISRKGLLLMGGLSAYVMAHTFLVSTSIPLSIKQIILIGVSVMFSFLLLNSYQFNTKELLRDYKFFIILACYVVVIQLIGVKTGLSFLYDYSYLGLDTGRIDLNAPRGRFHAWFYEPSFMAYAMTPVIFIAVARLFNIGDLIGKPVALFIIAILFATNSSLGLMGLLLSLLIVALTKFSFIKKPLFLIIAVFVITGGSLGIYQIPSVKLRIDQTYSLFSKKKATSSEVAQINLSTYALYSNYKVSMAGFKEAPVLGNGLGTYEKVYDKFLFEVIPPCNWRDNFKINRQDANSLLFRVLVELGIVGVLAMLFFVLRNRIRRIDEINVSSQNLWAINNGVFVLICLRVLRQGHYTMLGFILMLMLFYYSRKSFSREVK